ncbi:MAG: hypothetical protein Q7K43_03505, partial [Candidatus Woesearchaeota archaeon]|nr:hypothetical protein [Candidatus Woesearchaeota archaeon]
MVSLQETIVKFCCSKKESLSEYLLNCSTFRTPCQSSIRRQAHLSEPGKSIAQIAEVLSRDLYDGDIQMSSDKSAKLCSLFQPKQEQLNIIVSAFQVFTNPHLKMPSILSTAFEMCNLVYELPCAKGIVSFDVILATCLYVGCCAEIQTGTEGSEIAKYIAKGAEVLGLQFSPILNEKPNPATKTMPSAQSGSPTQPSVPPNIASPRYQEPDEKTEKPSSAWG